MGAQGTRTSFSIQLLSLLLIGTEENQENIIRDTRPPLEFEPGTSRTGDVAVVKHPVSSVWLTFMRLKERRREFGAVTSFRCRD
jgi:hypothetical protein